MTLVACAGLAAAACGGSVTSAEQPSIDASAPDASRAEAASVPAAACTEEPAVVPGSRRDWGYTLRLQSSGDALYWLWFRDGPFGYGTLYHLSRVVAESARALPTWVDARDFLVLGAHAFWFGSSGLVEVTISDDPTAIRNVGADGRFLRTDGRRVFWWAEGRLHRLDPVSGAMVELASVASPLDLAVDELHAYWVEKRGDRWSLFRAPAEPASGSEIEMILDDTGGLTSGTLSVDATHVYFWTGHDQGIHRVPKGGGASVLVGSSADPADRPPASPTRRLHPSRATFSPSRSHAYPETDSPGAMFSRAVAETHGNRTPAQHVGARRNQHEGASSSPTDDRSALRDDTRKDAGARGVGAIGQNPETVPTGAGSLLADLAALVARATESGDLALARALLDAQTQSAPPSTGAVVDMRAARARRR